jgi:hypothetical protein
MGGKGMTESIASDVNEKIARYYGGNLQKIKARKVYCKMPVEN